MDLDRRALGLGLRAEALVRPARAASSFAWYRHGYWRSPQRWRYVPYVPRERSEVARHGVRPAPPRAAAGRATPPPAERRGGERRERGEQRDGAAGTERGGARGGGGGGYVPRGGGRDRD